jgi:Outer membrane lipoprotein carrier protein LolA-like
MLGRRPLGVLILLAVAAFPRAGAGQPSPLDELMRRLAAVPERQAVFEEEKGIAGLTQPLRSTGRLVYRRPSHLEKITDPPHFESIVVDGERLLIKMGDEPPRSIDLDSYPEIGVLVDAVRGTLSGDLASLRRNYAVSMDGTLADWRLTLTPTDAKAQRFLREVTIAGAADEARIVRFVQANGDWSVMTIHPAP